ncbi:MAG TPA: antitoxin [Chloroflexota bacterium]|jgi:hypothetical protein
MARTTLDIDSVILTEVRALQKREARSMGSIVSELLAEALAQRAEPRPAPRLVWVSRPMTALIDVTDKDALYAALDES